MSRASACPVDHCLHVGRLALEDSFDCAVFTVGHPTGHPTRPRLTSASVAEEHTLHTSVGHHSATDHGTSLDHAPPGTTESGHRRQEDGRSHCPLGPLPPKD